MKRRNEREMSNIKAVIGTAVGAALIGKDFAQPISQVKNALGGTPKFTNHLGQRIVSPLGADLTAGARAASKGAMGLIAGAAAIGATAITHASNEATKGEARENEMRDTPAVGIGLKKKLKPGTTRRIARAMGEYR